MLKLDVLIKKLQAKRSGHARTESKLHAEMTKAFDREMRRKRKAIDALQAALDNSRDLSDVQDDEWVHRWVRYDFGKLIDVKDAERVKLLKEYLREGYCIEVDLDNDVAHTAEGPCIVINEDGDLYDQDSGKFFAKRSDYLGPEGFENHEKRNALIEAHMESTGHFPSVIRYGRSGVAGYVNTQAKVQP